MDLPVHLNFPGGISGMEVARNLASSLWGEQRATGDQTENLHGRGCGRDARRKEGSGVAAEALTVTRVRDFPMSRKGRGETAASHMLKIPLLHFLLNHAVRGPPGGASAKPRGQRGRQGVRWWCRKCKLPDRGVPSVPLLI